MAIIKEELKEEHKVGISGYKAARSPHKLITLGLGSCVGIVLFDASNRVGGLSHIMLPNSAQFKNNFQIQRYRCSWKKWRFLEPKSA